MWRLTAGYMSAYGSFAPATTNVWADNNYICYINCFTSFMAGFAIFSILGNMAWRQRGIADGNPQLRVNFCTTNPLDLAECTAMDCDSCSAEDWMNVATSICCGNFETGSVARAGVMLAFSVRCCSLRACRVRVTKRAPALSAMLFGCCVHVTKRAPALGALLLQ